MRWIGTLVLVVGCAGGGKMPDAGPLGGYDDAGPGRGRTEASSIPLDGALALDTMTMLPDATPGLEHAPADAAPDTTPDAFPARPTCESIRYNYSASGTYCGNKSADDFQCYINCGASPPPMSCLMSAVLVGCTNNRKPALCVRSCTECPPPGPPSCLQQDGGL